MSTDEIVVGLDGSPSATAALQWAAEHSRLTGWPLRILHVWQLSTLEAVAVSAELVEAATADARARATRWVLNALGGTSAEIRWTLVIDEGPPGPAPVEASVNSQLLVVGTREHTGLRRAVLGSVSHCCLSHGTPPVVAVPALTDVRRADLSGAHEEMAGSAPDKVSAQGVGKP